MWRSAFLLPLLREVLSAETQHITLTFQYVNGTWVPVVPPAPPPTYTLSTKVIAAIFLFLVFFVSITGNSLIISTVGSSLTLRRLHYNLLLLQVGVCGIVETGLNISLSTAYLLTQPWTFGFAVCRANCFLMEVVPAVYTSTLFLLLLDRTRALSAASSGHRKGHGGTTRIKFLLVFLWIFHITLCAPIIIGLVEAWPFPKRYSCQVMSELAGYYGGVTSVVCFILPWVVCIGLAIMLYRIIQGEKKREEKAARGHPAATTNKIASHTNAFLTSNQVWHELRNILMVMILLMLYLVLWVPYIVMAKGDQVRQQWQPYPMEVYRNLTHSYYEETPPVMAEVELDEAGEPTARQLDQVETEANLTLHDPGYWEVPEVSEGNIHETVFIWMRFLHAAIVPSVIFILNKEIRQKGTALLCCSRSNRLNSTAPRPLSALLAQQSREQNRQKQMSKFKLTNYHVPVLFATNQGLHLRVLDREVPVPAKEEKKHSEPGLQGSWGVEPEFETELCDLKIEGGNQDGGEKRGLPVLREETAEDGMLVEDTEKESVATDEGFHDDSTNDTDPLVGKKSRRKVQFRNTVLEIGTRNSSGSSGSIGLSNKRSNKSHAEGGRKSRLGHGRRSSEDGYSGGDGDRGGGGHHKRGIHEHRKKSREVGGGHRRRSHEDHGHGHHHHKKSKPDPDVELDTFTTLESSYGLVS